MRTNLATGVCTLLVAASILSLALAVPKPARRRQGTDTFVAIATQDDPTTDKLPDPTSPMKEVLVSGTTTEEHTGQDTSPDSTGERSARPDPTGEPSVLTKEDPDSKEDSYTHADFTKGNGTVEALLQELLMGNAPGRGRYSRALGCSSTPLYGTTSDGSAFVDFTTTSPWPCGVDITQIFIRHGSIIDAIQVTYKSYDGTQIIKDKHGENGGTLSVIVLSPGERIITVAGATDDTYLLQLTFVSRTATGEIKIHGPYGRISHGTTAYTFMVVGKINSIFGRSERYMNSIGFYYEAEGAHI